MVCELQLNKAVILRRKKKKEIKASHGDGGILISLWKF